MEINWHSMPDIAGRFDALFQLLNRLYTLEEVNLSLEGHPITVFKIGNINALLEEVSNQLIPSPDDIPYWSELWPSAIALARYLLRNEELEGQSVLELGCGIGLAGVAAGLGGADVLFTDLQPDALRLAELNWLMNVQRPAHTRQLDWRKPPDDLQFPLILAADVAYETRLFSPLIETFKRLLAPRGKILLSEPNRSIARQFFQQLQGEGFHWRRESETVVVPHGTVEISVYQIQHEGNRK